MTPRDKILYVVKRRVLSRASGRYHFRTVRVNGKPVIFTNRAIAERCADKLAETSTFGRDDYRVYVR